MTHDRPKSILDNPTLYAGTYLEFLGFKLIEWKEGYARLEMPVRGEHRIELAFFGGDLTWWNDDPVVKSADCNLGLLARQSDRIVAAKFIHFILAIQIHR